MNRRMFFATLFGAVGFGQPNPKPSTIPKVAAEVVRTPQYYMVKKYRFTNLSGGRVGLREVETRIVHEARLPLYTALNEKGHIDRSYVCLDNPEGVAGVSIFFSKPVPTSLPEAK